MARLFERVALVPMLDEDDVVSGATCESIYVGGCTHITLLVQFCSDLSGNPVLTIYEGATDGATTSAITFTYTYGGAAKGSANADVLEDASTSAALTCTGTTFVSRLLVIEFDMANMTDGYDWITPVFGSEASAGAVTMVAVCDYKYPSPEDATLLS